MKWRVVWVAVAAAAVGFVAVAILGPNEIPFERARWQAEPAELRWATSNTRYRMRNGAVRAARQCHSTAEVVSLLGKPDGDDQPQASSGRADGLMYSLGALRHPVEFWEIGAVSFIQVQVDDARHTVDARVVDLPIR